MSELKNEIPGKWEWCPACLFWHDPRKECMDQSGWKKTTC